jgi:predicted O-methyltransferase YrrM
MFHKIPQPIARRMAYLEALDTRDRQDGTPRLERLRQIPPVTGRFLALQAAAAPPGKFIEIGTSAGYSSLWIGLACRARRTRLTTFEVLEEKVRLAQETFSATGMTEVIELVHGDAREHLRQSDELAFCFLDAEKEVYTDCFELAADNFVPGGLFLADNLINHAETLRPFQEQVEADPRFDALVVPVGKGVLLARRV